MPRITGVDFKEISEERTSEYSCGVVVERDVDTSAAFIGSEILCNNRYRLETKIMAT